MQYTRYFFLRNAPMGQGTQGPQWVHNAHPQTPESVHFLCPICGDCWGAAIIDAPGTYHRALHRNCDKHRGGNFLITWLDGYNASLSPEIMAREIVRAMEDLPKYFTNL